jgi:hypothetical protein
MKTRARRDADRACAGATMADVRYFAPRGGGGYQRGNPVRVRLALRFRALALARGLSLDVEV